MNVIDDTKLQTAADEVVDRAAARLGTIISAVYADLDGWTLTIHIPQFTIWKLPVNIPDITVRLNKPKEIK